MVILKLFIPLFLLSLFFSPPLAFKHLAWLRKTTTQKNCFLTFPSVSKIFIHGTIFTSSSCTHQPIWIWILRCWTMPLPFYWNHSHQGYQWELYTEWNRPISDLILLDSWVTLGIVGCLSLKYFLGLWHILSSFYFYLFNCFLLASVVDSYVLVLLCLALG